MCGTVFVPSEGDGMVEVWDRDEVPGIASQRTRLESATVEDEMGDDHFYDFVRERDGRFVYGACLRRRARAQTADHGFPSIPNDMGQEGDPCADNVDVRNVLFC